MRPLVLLVLSAVLLAGCAAPLSSSTDDRGAAPPAADAPGCDASRPAVAHRAGGLPVAAPAAPRPVPCFAYTGAASAEPTIGIHPTSGAVFHYPASGGGKYGVARSADEGATWEVREPQVAGRRAHALSLDPYFYLDPGTGRLFADDLVTPNCSLLSWSDDEGATWTHTLAGCAEFDHQTYFAGPPVSSPTVGYPNVVYRCAINAVAVQGLSTASTCMKSLDGGLTFVPTGAPAFVTDPARKGHQGLSGYCDGAHGHGVVDAAGVVYLPKGWCGEPWLAISKDEGATWTRVQVAENGMPLDQNGYLDHEASVGVDPDGNVYYFWVARDRLPYLSVSRDGGATWSEPLMVGVPGLKESSLPQLAVGATGRVAFVYYGSTDAPDEFQEMENLDGCAADLVACLVGAEPEGYEGVTWSAYLGVSLDALAADPTFLTVSANPPTSPLVRGPCGPTRCGAVYDFIDVRIGPDGTPWAALVDATGGGEGRGAVGRVVGVDLLR